MNERLLELYKQARVPDTFTDPSNNMPCETTSFSAEKFAELIIKECLSCCRTVEADDELTGVADGALLCVEEIKERFHFGEKW